MNFLQFISESVIDIPHKTLDKKVFTDDLSDEPKLVNSIKQQVLMGLDEFRQIAMINKAYIVGSILTRRYNDDSDIDVTMEVDPDTTDEITKSKLMELVRNLSGKLAGQSSHPINYHVTFVEPGKDISGQFENIYDFENDRWLKKTPEYTTDVNSYMQEFAKKVSSLDLAAMQIRRDIIDINILKKLDKDQVENLKQMVEAKLWEIQKAIAMMATTREEMHKLRRIAFERPLTPEELNKIKSRQELPENIIYKLMERYYYWALIDELKKIAGPDQEIKTTDVADVEKAIEDFTKRAKAVPPPVEERMSFLDYQVMCEKVNLKKPRMPKPPSLAIPGMSHANKSRRKQKAKNDALKQRGNDRMTDRLISAWRSTHLEEFPMSEFIPNEFNAIKELKLAKKADFGQWWLNKIQAKWIAAQYHFDMPSRKDPIKQLSNMPIVLWRSPTGHYYLFKDKRLKHRNKSPYEKFAKTKFEKIKKTSTGKFTQNVYNNRRKRKVRKWDEENSHEKKHNKRWRNDVGYSKNNNHRFDRRQKWQNK